MKLYLKIIISIQIGMLVGGLAVWAGTSVYSNSAVVENSEKIQRQLSRLIRYANAPIKAENFSCDFVALAGLKPTVGNVLALMMSSNLTTIQNRQSFDCFENTCSLSISDCEPGQSSECSQRFLKYEVDNQQKIKPTTFSCIDVP